MPKKRRRPTTRKAVPTEPVISPDELRWRHNRLRRRINTTATPFDAYRYAKLITQRQFDAGDKLRDIWHRAGRAPKLTSDLELISYGHPEMTDAQAAAWKKLAAMLKPLNPNHRALVHDVCCFEHGAEHTVANLGQPAHVGLLVLRAALEALSRPKRKRAA